MQARQKQLSTRWGTQRLARAIDVSQQVLSLLGNAARVRAGVRRKQREKTTEALVGWDRGDGKYFLSQGVRRAEDFLLLNLGTRSQSCSA